jgi:general secretion pathway protein D
LVTLSFNNAEIGEVARAVALITGRSVVLDPRVKGTVTLNTDRPVSKAAAYSQFLAALRLQGFAVVETAGLYKVVPEAEAKLQGGGVIETTPSGPGSQIATQIFRLQHESANNLVPVLRPLISPNNTINVNTGNNSLVITDYNDNLQRIGRIVAVLDVPNASDLEIIPLKHAIASDVAPLLTRLLESQGPGPAAAQGASDTSYRTAVQAEPRANAVIIRAANAARAALARSLLERLDQPGSQAGPAGNIHVVYLKNAEATKLAATLRAAMAANDGRSGSTAPATPSSPAQHRRPESSRPDHQRPDHQRARAAVPPTARGDRPARHPARPGARREPDRGGAGRQGRRVRHSVAGPGRQPRRRHHRLSGHEFRHRWKQHPDPAEPGRKRHRAARTGL